MATSRRDFFAEVGGIGLGSFFLATGTLYADGSQPQANPPASMIFETVFTEGVGFKDVRNVPGSWKAWKAAGYAVQKPKERKKGTDTNLS